MVRWMTSLQATAIVALITMVPGCMSDDDAGTTDAENASRDAGQAASSGEESTPSPHGDGVALQDTNRSRPKPVDLYRFSGVVTGASAAHPAEPGVLGGVVPPAKVDTFEIGEEEFDKLLVGVDRTTGTGSCRVEVYDPNGELAYSSTTDYGAGRPGEDFVGIRVLLSEYERTGRPPAGTYEVHYLVSGSFEYNVHVQGMPA